MKKQNILELIEKYDRKITIDNCIKIIEENDELKKYIINTIGDKKEILFDDLNGYGLNNNTLITLLEAYCVNKNIEINYGDIENNYNDSEIYCNKNNEYDPVKIFLADVGKYKLLTADEEKELFLKYKNGDKKAREKIINHNYRLVISVGKKYTERGLSFLDIMEEGNIGLMKAVEKFDVSKGYKFSTYATWWIKQSITRAISDQVRTIRIPVYALEIINKINYYQKTLSTELGHEPRDFEIAEKMNMPVKKIKKFLMLSQEPVSLESPISEENDNCLGDFICDDGAINPENYALEKTISDDMIKLIKELPERHANILLERYGFYDEIPKTLQEIGEANGGLSRERIRQIEGSGIKKVKTKLIRKYGRNFFTENSDK